MSIALILALSVTLQSGSDIYEAFPKPLQKNLRLAWAAKVKRTEKQLRSAKRSVTRERNKKKKAKLKESQRLLEAFLKHLKTKNDPPFIGININTLHSTRSRNRGKNTVNVTYHSWEVGDFGLSQYSVEVIQVINDDTLIVDYKYLNTGLLMLNGWSTKNIKDGDSLKSYKPLWVSKTTSYTSVLGAKKTVLFVEPFNWRKWKKANIKKPAK